MGACQGVVIAMNHLRVDAAELRCVEAHHLGDDGGRAQQLHQHLQPESDRAHQMLHHVRVTPGPVEGVPPGEQFILSRPPGETALVRQKRKKIGTIKRMIMVA